MDILTADSEPATPARQEASRVMSRHTASHLCDGTKDPVPVNEGNGELSSQAFQPDRHYSSAQHYACQREWMAGHKNGEAY